MLGFPRVQKFMKNYPEVLENILKRSLETGKGVFESIAPLNLLANFLGANYQFSKSSGGEHLAVGRTERESKRLISSRYTCPSGLSDSIFCSTRSYE